MTSHPAPHARSNPAPAKPAFVAGIDSSTQSCKVAIVDVATGAVVRSGRASHPSGTEVDPEVWWQALTEAIADAGGLDDVSAVSVGGQQHGMVVLDAAGRVIRPALLWNDTRSAAAAAALNSEFPDLAARTGSTPVASFTSTKLRWLRDNEPENAANVAAVCLPHDWLTWCLRGFGPENPQLSELTTDRSDASGTGYFSSVTNQYDDEVFAAALGRELDSTAALLGVDHNELGTLALQAEPGAEGLVLQPYFDGERTPNLPDATATLFGMTLASTTRPSLARAAIEGLLCGLADGLDALNRQGVSAHRILLIGGAAQNPAVSTIAAQVFAVPVAVPGPGEYVARGAAAQAAWVLTGARPEWSIAMVAEPASDYRPVIRQQYARYSAVTSGVS